MTKAAPKKKVMADTEEMYKKGGKKKMPMYKKGGKKK